MDDNDKAAKILKSIFKELTEGEPCTMKACRQALIKFDLTYEKVVAFEEAIYDAEPEAEIEWVDIRWFITHVTDGGDPSTYKPY